MEPFSPLVAAAAFPQETPLVTGDPPTGTKPVPSPNYTNTKDPNVKIGKHGLRITKQDFENANKNGYAWENLDAYADWLGGWAKKLPVQKATYPYHRTYPQGKIGAGDIALLEAKDDPQVNAILQRNIAGKNEIPLYGAEDSDYLRAMINTVRPNPDMASYYAAKAKAIPQK